VLAKTDPTTSAAPECRPGVELAAPASWVELRENREWVVSRDYRPLGDVDRRAMREASLDFFVRYVPGRGRRGKRRAIVNRLGITVAGLADVHSIVDLCAAFLDTLPATYPAHALGADALEARFASFLHALKAGIEKGSES